MRYLARRFTAVQNFLNFAQLTPRCVQTKLYLARRFTAVQNFLNFVQLTPRCVQTKLYLARRFTAVQNFLNFVQLTPRCVQTKISPSFWSITAFSGGHRVTLCPPLPLRSLREQQFYPQKYDAFSANSMIVALSVSRKKGRARRRRRARIFLSSRANASPKRCPLRQGEVPRMGR